MQNFLNTHKTLATAILFAALGAGSVSSAHAEEVGEGILIVRDGAANTKANYQHQERDINDRLVRVSALCASRKNYTDVAALVATDTTRVWGAPKSSKTTAVINKGGHVVKDPQEGNPNHCLINGMKLSDITGIWH